MWKTKTIFFLLLTLFSLPQLLKAQSLGGKKIYISPSRAVVIKFPSVITDFNIQNKASANGFEVRTRNRKNLYIRSNLAAFRTTSLVVKERWNTHIFILEYKQTPNGSPDTVYDYSGRNALAEEAASIQQTAVNVPVRQSSIGANSKAPAAPVTGITSPAAMDEKRVLENYTELEMKANVSYTSGNLDEAKYLYQKALKLQPDAQWPAWQLNKIEAKKLADARKQYEHVCNFCYTKHKTTGDSAFNKKAYELAKSEYTQALKYKSTDSYVASQIAKIEKMERDKHYTELIKTGREALTASSLAEAESAFREAQHFSVNDTEAKKGLAEVVTRRTELLKKESPADENSTTLNEYIDTIAIADQLFKVASYDAAKKMYNKAEAFKSGDAYARKKIAEIDSILAVRKQVLDSRKKDAGNAALYTTTTGKADKAYDAGDVKKAKAAPLARAKEKQRERSEKFNEAFKVYRKADEARIEQKYHEAFTGFNTFLDNVDTTNLSFYEMSEQYYINQAKDYIQMLNSYKYQPVQSKKETPQEDKRKRRSIKTGK